MSHHLGKHDPLLIAAELRRHLPTRQLCGGEMDDEDCRWVNDGHCSLHRAGIYVVAEWAAACLENARSGKPSE